MRQKRDGRCQLCPKKRVTEYHCRKHAVAAREREFKRQRKESGVPYSQPLSRRGRPRFEAQKKVEINY